MPAHALVPRQSFLQSPEWERFQRAVGRKTWRLGGALVIRHDLPMGMSYLYCPRPDAGIWKLESGVWKKEAREIARKERSLFLKIDPAREFQVPRLRPCFGGQASSKFQVQEVSSLQPRETVIIDLTKSEGELLSAMREKTRYNIGLAERHGVRITNHESRTTGQGLQQFWRLLQETAKRDGFHTHPRAYYEKLLDARSDNFSNELFFAEYRGQAIAAAVINFYRSTATYLHGASSREYREVMAPHLLHWSIMQDAKRRGCVSYDLWGIDEKKWSGLTRFKRGFGGREALYPPSADIVYRPAFYRGYQTWKRFWRK